MQLCKSFYPILSHYGSKPCQVCVKNQLKTAKLQWNSNIGD